MYFDMQELLHLAVKIEGQLAWEKENSKRFGIPKSTIFNTWKKNTNIEKIDFKVRGKYELDKKNKAETSKGKRKRRNIRRFEKEIKTSNVGNVNELVILVMIVLTRES